MPFLAFLLLFFFLELFLMVMVAVEHGWGWGVFWFEVGTALLGVALVRRNQELTIREMLRQAGGRLHPGLGLSLFRSARTMIGGMLLILPGLLTDGLGAALLILPGLHSFLLGLLKFPSSRRPAEPPKPSESNPSGRIVEGEIEPPRDDPDRR